MPCFPASCLFQLAISAPLSCLCCPCACPCRHVVASVNENMRPYGFAVQEGRTEGDGKLFYVFANTVSCR